jgi:hypothetical protein
MRAGADDPEVELLRSLHAAGVRYLLIGRQACVQYGLPVMTFDYDLWVDPEPANLAALVGCAEGLDLRPTVALERLAEVGVFALENGARIDVFKVREFVASATEYCTFSEAWEERHELRDDAANLVVVVPKLEHLIVTKLCGRRKRDIEDVKALRVILELERGGSG